MTATVVATATVSIDPENLWRTIVSFASRCVYCSAQEPKLHSNDGRLANSASPAFRYSGAPAIATGTSVPVLGAGFAQVTVPRTLDPWARAWDSVMVSFSCSFGALRASFHVATLLATP